MSGKTALVVLRVGLIAGTLDIADALIFSNLRGVTAAQVFRYIASGLLGPRAFEMGATACALGVLIHYSIALGWTGAFYAVSRKFGVMRRRPVASGLLYGVAVYVIMNFIVLPLSAVPRIGHVSLAGRVNGVLALMLCLGLTVSLLLRRNMPEG